MIYEPVQIVETPGIKNTSYGVGILTSQGAFVTGPIPPFTRIHVTAFIPGKTIFKRLSGLAYPYEIPKAAALGVKVVDATLPKPKQHIEKVTMSLTRVADLPGDIIVEEMEQNKFKIYILTHIARKVYQPFNGWSMAF